MYHMMIINNLFLSVSKVMQPINPLKNYCRRETVKKVYKPDLHSNAVVVASGRTWPITS